MNAVAQLLGISDPHCALKFGEDTCDETCIVIDAGQVQEMSEVASRTDASLAQLLQKSNEFEKDISRLGKDMSALQSRSSSLRARLSARENALEALEPLQLQLTLPCDVAKEICEGPITNEWFENVQKLSGFVIPETVKGHAAEDARKLRQALVGRAMDRIKLFYVHQFKVLRKPGSNAQLVQQHIIDSHDAMNFLRTEMPRLATALTQAYRNTMHWYYTLLFGKYGRWLQRQTVLAPDHLRLLGSAIASQHHGLLGMGHSSVKYVESFNLGMRHTVLETPNPGYRNEGLIPLHALQTQTGTTYPVEQLIRSALGTLANSFEVEDEVIKSTMHSEESITELFKPTLTFYNDIIEKWVHTARYDLFGLLITVRLFQESGLAQWAPDFVDPLVQKCWMHIVHICTSQAESIEQASLKSSVAANDSHKTVGPHMLTQMFSSYLSGILQLGTSSPEIELETSVRSLCEAYELFITKLAGGNEDILYNNYFVMLALLSDVDGPLAHDLTRHFDLLVKAYQPNQ